MNNPQPRNGCETIIQDARMLSALYPDLYAYLVQRDQMLHRLLLRFPDPADPEAGAEGVDFGRLVMELKALPPGLSELGRAQHTNSRQAQTIHEVTTDH